MDETDVSLLKFLNKSREDSEKHLETNNNKLSSRTEPDEIDGPLGPKISVPANTDFYNTDHPNLGVALIFNHKHIRGESPRYGTEKDRDRLRRILLDYGFSVKCFDDPTFAEISETLDMVAKDDHKHNDCLIVAVMTHGEIGKIYAKDMLYPVDRLWKPFLGNSCRSLINKPKIFFIQACRGNDVDTGVQYSGFATMSRSADQIDAQRKQQIFHIPSTADLIVMYSTYDENFSFRNPTNGSWFIQSLCEELEKACRSGNPVELYRLLTAVSRRVAYEYQSNVPQNSALDQMKEMPNFISTLTKIFHLCPKND